MTAPDVPPSAPVGRDHPGLEGREEQRRRHPAQPGTHTRSVFYFWDPHAECFLFPGFFGNISQFPQLGGGEVGQDLHIFFYVYHGAQEYMTYIG